METFHPLAQRPHRLGLKRQLMLAFGLISLLLLLALVTQLISLAMIARSTRQTIEVDSRLSQIAGDIAVHTLLCRRFEKDMLLNIADPPTRADYFARWQSTYADLGTAIGAFALVAPGDAGRQQAERWQGEWLLYGNAVIEVEADIARGELTTPQASNAALSPRKDSIRSLTDSAVAVAAEQAQAAKQAGAMLQTSIAQTITLAGAIGGLALVAALVWSLWFPTQFLRPIAMLRAAVRRIAAGDLTARTGFTRPDELGDLAQGFDAMASQIAARTADLAQQYADAEAARQAADTARQQVAEQLVTITSQGQVIRELSVPLLPLSTGTLVMPLVGALDSARLHMAQERALGALARSRTSYLILDVTGVPVIDTQVAQGLMRLVQAARLLGARVCVVGVQPEVAQTLVGLGVEFAGLNFQATLQEALVRRS